MHVEWHWYRSMYLAHKGLVEVTGAQLRDQMEYPVMVVPGPAPLNARDVMDEYQCLIRNAAWLIGRYVYGCTGWYCILILYGCAVLWLLWHLRIWGDLVGRDERVDTYLSVLTVSSRPAHEILCRALLSLLGYNSLNANNMAIMLWSGPCCCLVSLVADRTHWLIDWYGQVSACVTSYVCIL